jgi:predicted nucleotidyltransferase
VTTAADRLRALGREMVPAALARVPLRGALLAGSAGRGDADFYSDLDLLLYVDALPGPEVLPGLRRAVGGDEPVEPRSDEGFLGEVFFVRGVRTEVSFVTVEVVERRLDELLSDVERFDSPSQKILMGIAEGLPLYGEGLVRRWQERLRTYPEALRVRMIERHWRILPLWYYHDVIAARDAELWRLDALLDAAFDLLAVLAALNRVYFTRFELKRTRQLVSRLERAPPRLADGLESLFRLEPEAAASELGRLVEETRALVLAELPQAELPLSFPPGTRQLPWWTQHSELDLSRRSIDTSATK